MFLIPVARVDQVRLRLRRPFDTPHCRRSSKRARTSSQVGYGPGFRSRSRSRRSSSSACSGDSGRASGSPCRSRQSSSTRSSRSSALNFEKAARSSSFRHVFLRRGQLNGTMPMRAGRRNTHPACTPTRRPAGPCRACARDAPASAHHHQLRREPVEVLLVGDPHEIPHPRALVRRGEALRANRAACAIPARSASGSGRTRAPRRDRSRAAGSSTSSAKRLSLG